ncbi:hypothetical protein REPUB_Repub14bG0096600 [Reevesia pubescens]
MAATATSHAHQDVKRRARFMYKNRTKVAGKIAAKHSFGSTATVNDDYGGGGGGGGGFGHVSMLTKGLSFKNLDRMILEVPPMDELKWLWAN